MSGFLLVAALSLTVAACLGTADRAPFGVRVPAGRSLRQDQTQSGWGDEERRWMQPDGLLPLDYLRRSGIGPSNSSNPTGLHPSLHRRWLRSGIYRTHFCRAAPEPPVGDGNLFQNPSFQRGAAGWNGFGGSVKTVTGKGGLTFGVVSGRPGIYSGPAQEMSNMQPGYYQLIIWVRLNKGPRQYTQAMLRTGSTTDPTYLCVGSAIAKSHCWTKLMGGFRLDSPQGTAAVYLQGPSADVDIWFASATLLHLDDRSWRKEQNNRISKHRMRPVSLSVVDARGSPVRGASIQIDQVKSEFPFGGGTNGGILYDKKYQDWFLARFNWAVYSNEAKWYCVEWQRGSVNYTIPQLMTQFLRRKGVKIRGHNLFWDVQNYVQGWLQSLSNSELWAKMQEHARSEVSFFRGQFEHWDVLNEPLHGNFYDSRLGPQVLSWMFKAARQYDPKPQLFVNDFNTVEQCDGFSHPEYYLAKVWGMSILNGAPVGGIGVESHFSSAPMPARIRHDLDQLAVANIPIWVTELDISGALSKAQQADYFEDYMREAFSHPAVEGIMLWTTAQVPCSLYQNPDPSWCTQKCTNCLADNVGGAYVDNELGDRYVRLRKEWSTHLVSKTGARGSLVFRGFHGSYRARVLVNGQSFTAYFDVPKGSSPLKAEIQI